MFLLSGNWIAAARQTLDNQNLLDSAMIKNKSIIKKLDITNYYLHENRWHNEAELQRHYWAASFLLPFGSIFILAVVIILMILFKRYPHMVAVIVAGLFGIIIIFALLASINHTPQYF